MKMKEIEKGEMKKRKCKENKRKRKRKQKGLAAARFSGTRYS